ncbi:MAG: glycosyltransferase family 2 protein [Planctomycetes bacterium]|nr:glycosyltransferase family 2 protein [Planctomycetota bacterium]
MNPSWVEWAFWISVAGLFYIYCGYPLLVWLLAKWRPGERRKNRTASTVSVVIAAHNEAKNLDRKLRSILAAQGQERIREIIVASDGSTDATESVVRSFDDPRVRLMAFPQRRGKPSVLNDVIPQCAGEIVVLTDARQELSPDAINELAESFADPTIGAVSGELVFRSAEDTTTASTGVGAYWTYEKFIRKCEARFRSVPGATGALYAIRKELFRPIPPDTILDDVVIPMQIVEQGYRVVFEPKAVAYDRPCRSPKQEAVRKRRTIAGTFQLVVNQPRWLLPWKNPIWFEFVSHKLLRLISPALLATAAAANVALRAEPLYFVLLAVHADFYLAALTGWAFQRSGKKSVCFAAPFMFLTLNGVTVAALWDALRRRYQTTWRRAAIGP